MKTSHQNIDINNIPHTHSAPNESTTNKSYQMNEHSNNQEPFNEINQNIRKSTITKHKHNHLSYNIYNLSLDSVKPNSSCILYPICHYHSYASISNSYTTQECWLIQVINYELQVSQQNKTWVLWPFQLISNLYETSVFTKRNTSKIVQLKEIRQCWLQRDTIKWKKFISLKYSHL